MENKKQKESDVETYISRIVDPIFNKVLKETPKNPMMVGSKVKEFSKYCLYQPHNYRLYFDFKKDKFKPETVPNSAVKPLLPVEHKISNSKEHSYNNFLGCRITVKKTQVEIINKIES